ncbi:hypothetical protein MMPV_003467 [Pyropia vietnamensis]
MAFVPAAAAPTPTPRPAAASSFVVPVGAAAGVTAPRRARLPVVAPARVAAAGGGGDVVQMAVVVGSPAPPFTLPTDGGGEVSLSDLRGKKVVLYFYPRDDTPGCTKEAQGFRDAADRLAAANAVVVGVSGDSVESHDAFKAKYGLNFALASDEAKSMLEAYGVWQLRQMFGKEFMGVVRSTFVIDSEGAVAREWRGVTVDGHVEEVVSYVESM